MSTARRSAREADFCRSGQIRIPAHHERGGRLAVRPPIIARALADLDEAETMIKLDRGHIVGVHLEKKGACARERRALHMLAHEVAPDPAMAPGGIDRDRQYLGLVRRQPGKREAAKAISQRIERRRADRRRAPQQSREFARRPGMRKSGGMNRGAFLGAIRAQGPDDGGGYPAKRKGHAAVRSAFRSRDPAGRGGMRVGRLDVERARRRRGRIGSQPDARHRENVGIGSRLGHIDARHSLSKHRVALGSGLTRPAYSA